MKEFNIKITDTGDVYVNGNLHQFDLPMDKNNPEDDLNKKALVALANEMEYEPTFLFEEMVSRLDTMLDELDGLYDDSMSDTESNPTTISEYAEEGINTYA